MWQWSKSAIQKQLHWLPEFVFELRSNRKWNFYWLNIPEVQFVWLRVTVLIVSVPSLIVGLGSRQFRFGILSWASSVAVFSYCCYPSRWCITDSIEETLNKLKQISPRRSLNMNFFLSHMHRSKIFFIYLFIYFFLFKDVFASYDEHCVWERISFGLIFVRSTWMFCTSGY
jgi:hypothetical protein